MLRRSGLVSISSMFICLSVCGYVCRDVYRMRRRSCALFYFVTCFTLREGEREAVLLIVVCCHMLYCLGLERQSERGGTVACSMLSHALLALLERLAACKSAACGDRDRD